MSFINFIVDEITDLYKVDIGSTMKQIRNIFVKAGESKRPRDPRPLVTCDKRVTLNFNHYNTYFSALSMVLVTKDNKIISIPTGCREFFNEVIRHQVTNINGASYAVTSTSNMMDRDNLRVGLLLDQPYNNRIKILDGLMNGIRVANMYGRVVGWAPLEIEHCRIEQVGREEPTDFYIMTGDANWQRMPQYISMLILILRLCLKYQVPEWVEDAYSMGGYWHELVNSEVINADVDRFLKNSYRSLLTLVAHDEEIFPHDIEDGYSSEIKYFYGKSGLDSLVTGNSSHPDSTKKLTQLCMEAKEWQSEAAE